MANDWKELENLIEELVWDAKVKCVLLKMLQRMKKTYESIPEVE